MQNNFLEDIDFDTFKKHFDKPVIIGLRVIDLVRLCSLLCDVSLGTLPSYHLEEGRVDYYKSLSHTLNDVIFRVCKDEDIKDDKKE